jgi:hypothetical protein
MPIMDGYDASIQIRELEAKAARQPIPIIAMTGKQFIPLYYYSSLQLYRQVLPHSKKKTWHKIVFK